MFYKDRTMELSTLENYAIHEGFNMDPMIATICKDGNTKNTAMKKKFNN